MTTKITSPLKTVAVSVTPLAVTISEAAVMLSISEDTVRREITRGKLGAIRIGRLLRIKMVELQSYMKRIELKAGV